MTFRNVHWVSAEGAALYCHCGPQQGWSANDDGYACQECAARLPEGSLMRRTNCEMPCCYCDNPAVWRLHGHPQRRDESA